MRNEDMEYGLTPAYIHPGNPSLARSTGGVVELGERPGQITLIWVSVSSEFEITDFQAEVGKLGPMGAVLAVPIGSANPSDRRRGGVWRW